jgi:hypothetical protein
LEAAARARVGRALIPGTMEDGARKVVASARDYVAALDGA